MNIDTSKLDPDKLIKMLAGFVILAVFALNSIATYYHPIPEPNKDAATRTSGMIETVVVLVIGYYFGSSLSSAKNAQRLNDVLNTAIPTGGAVQQTTTQTTKVQKDGEQPPA